MGWKPESVPDVLQPGTNEFEMVEFWMYHEKEDGSIYTYLFGVNVAKVKEVVWLPEIIKVPNLPEAIVGVINLRGQVIPLIDLASWMHIKEPSTLKRKSVIVAEFYKVKIGFIVHEAKRIRRVSWNAIKPAPDVLVARFGTKITGVIEVGEGKFLLILDLENVLAELGLISMPEEISVEKVPEDIKGPVLLADDSSVARKILKDIYTKAGFDELIVVKDGLEAWKTLLAIAEKAEQEGFDILDAVSLVVTDVEMPQMDGYTLAKRIKTHPVLKRIPVIINTSLSEESNIEKAEQVHADAFFVKFEPEELIKVSRELIYKAKKGELGGKVLSNIRSTKTEEEVKKNSEVTSIVSNPSPKQEKPQEETMIPNEEVKNEELKEPTKATENQKTDSSQQLDAADEIDKILKEFGINTDISSESAQEVSSDESKEEKEEQTVAVDDIDALIESFQNQGEQSEDVEGVSTDASEEVAEDVPDIVDQILAELETGKMGSEEVDIEGTYEVPTMNKLLERTDLDEIIQKLEEKLVTLSDEKSELKAELTALISAIKQQVALQKKEKEETRVVAKLYKVTRETEEKTVKLMEMLEQAMNAATDCMSLTEQIQDQELKDKINEKLNEINDILFNAMNHLQFQDITRQKIERVIAALKKLNDYLNEWFGTDFIGD